MTWQSVQFFQCRTKTKKAKVGIKAAILEEVHYGMLSTNSPSTIKSIFAFTFTWIRIDAVLTLESSSWSVISCALYLTVATYDQCACALRISGYVTTTLMISNIVIYKVFVKMCLSIV